MGNEAAIAVEQIDDRGMVHQVGRAVLAGHLLEVDAVGARRRRDLFGRPGQADEARAEIADVSLEQLGRVALGIDGDEDQVDLLRRVGPELVDRRLHQQQRGRADVGAEGVAEIDQGRLALELLARERLAVLIDQREGPADRRLPAVPGVPADPAGRRHQHGDPHAQQGLHEARHGGNMRGNARLDKPDGWSHNRS
jgi:hypothetical protein